ncbi:MAG: helix-turn-helix transcriptional regulator [Chloroflexi bacterium]|nr:helix-turn-helix transcriptional regulator [Chloroflexota bacterium]
MEQLRQERGWSLHDLARESGVPYRTLSKLELRSKPLRSSKYLDSIAKAFGVHPNRLLVPAVLTPMLQPTPTTPETPARQERSFVLTDEEYAQLDIFLQFLRFIATSAVSPRSPA